MAQKFKKGQLVRGALSGTIYKILSYDGGSYQTIVIEPKSFVSNVSKKGDVTRNTEDALLYMDNPSRHPLTNIFM